MMHDEPHPLAGQTVEFGVSRVPFVVEDWADRVFGGSWGYADGNVTALAYATRLPYAGLPLDNEVLYGKVGGMAALAHITEIQEAGS